MPEYEQRSLTFAQRVDGRWWMSQVALSPEHSVLSLDAEKGRELLARRTKDTIESLAIAELYQRRWGWDYEVRRSEIVVSPPRDALWQPVTLHFDWIAWSPATDCQIAYVPALDLEVLQSPALCSEKGVGSFERWKSPVDLRPRELPTPFSEQSRSRAERLSAAVEQEIRAALERLGGQNPLAHFVQLERRHGLEVADSSITVELRAPKEAARRALEESGAEKSVLKQIASDLTRQELPEAFEAEAAVAQLAELLGGAAPRSVLLVGPAGVGKTAALYQLVRERSRRGLGRTPFWSTSGARLVAGMSGFGMWQEQCRDLCREAARKKAVVYLGNLADLAEVGRSASQSESIATFLRPSLLRGELIAVAECTPQQQALIERDVPQVLPAFSLLRIRRARSPARAADPGKASRGQRARRRQPRCRRDRHARPFAPPLRRLLGLSWQTVATA